MVLKIITIIVTHNRCQLLERCLQHVLSQTRRPDTLLVINHESTDGTEKLLNEQGVQYITQKNLGAAAGWSRGIEYALAFDYDAVWMMDDDGFPALDALKQLEESLVSPRVCVSSVVLQEDNPEEFVFPFPRLNSNQLPIILGKPRKIKKLKELKAYCAQETYPFVHLFNGALISTKAIQSIGNVNKNFFIYGEEVDYFFRLREQGEVVSLLNAYHYHPNVALRPYNEKKIYYYLKNTLILNQYYFDYVWIRHMMALVIILFRTWKRNGQKDLMKLIVNPKLYQAFKRGLQGKISHDF